MRTSRVLEQHFATDHTQLQINMFKYIYFEFEEDGKCHKQIFWISPYCKWLINNGNIDQTRIKETYKIGRTF